MKTVGSILKEARIAKGITTGQVERDIKIREKFIRAIEADSFHELPSPSYAKGFVKNYASYMGLNTEDILAFYRRQMTDVAKNSLLPKGMADPLNKPIFYLTPGRFIGLLVGIFLCIFLIYLGGQYLRISKPPKLSITSPNAQQVYTQQHIAIEGQTDPDVSLVINSVSVIVRDDGRFYFQISLKPGINNITVTATSRFGKETTISREVGYFPKNDN